MPIESHRPQSEDRITHIKVTGRFDYGLYKAFRETYAHCQEPGMQFRVDLSHAEYMDSSALGMLLMLKEHSDQLHGKVELLRPQQDVKRVLHIANFEQFFTIRD